MDKLASDVSLVDGYNVGGKQFYLRLNGISDCVCEWYPTQSWEGFGADRRLVTYPHGAILVHLSFSTKKIVKSLDEAKSAVAQHYNETYLKV